MNSYIQPVNPEWASFGMIMVAIGVYTLVRSTLIQGCALILVQSVPCFRHRRIFRIPWARDQLLKELDAGLGVLAIDAIFFSVLIHFSVLTPSAPSWLAHLSGFGISFVWIEIWFYLTHRLFHRPAWYFIHAQHHVAKVTSPMSALSFSILERLILLLGSFLPLALLSRRVPMSSLGIGLNLFVNYLLNVYGHLNVELVPPKWLRTPGARILNTTTYHALHHARYRGHFGLYTPFMDWIFGTRFPDYLRIQAAAYDGEGPTKLAAGHDPRDKRSPQ